MIKSQNSIMSFYYQRSHNVHGAWVDLDQDLLNMQKNTPIDIDFWIDNELQTIVLVGEL